MRFHNISQSPRYIFLTTFLDVFTYGVILPLLPFIVQQNGGGAAITGLVAASYAVMQLISGPILGPLSDKVGRRPVLLGCLLGTFVAYFLLASGQGLLWIFIAVIIDGLTGGNLGTAQAYVSDTTSEEERAAGIGMIGAAMGFGLMTGPALGGWLSTFDLYAPAYAACVIALMNLAFTWILLPESLPKEQRTFALKIRELNLITQFKQTWNISTIRIFLLLLFLLNLSFSGLQSNFPLFSQARYGWQALENGIFFAFVGIIGALTQGFLIGKLTPRWGEKHLSVLGLCFLMLGLMGIALSVKAWGLFPIVGLAAFGSGIGIPSLTSLISKSANQSQQGQIMGVIQSLLSLTAIFGPIIAGLTFESIHPTAPYWFGAAVALTAFFLAIRSFNLKNADAP